MAQPHPHDVSHEPSFLTELRPRDLERLRNVTRRAHLKATGRVLSDWYVDYVIERLGPVTAEKLIKQAVDNKDVN